MISLGQAHETELTLEKAGATTEFWTRLARNLELAKATVTFVMGMIFQLVAKIDRDMTGWTCLKPLEAEEGEFEPTLHEFLREGENSINGEEMVNRAKEQAVLTGLRHAEAMLRNQERIPVEWRKYYLVFPEVWQGPLGDRNAWYLYWLGGHWYLDFYWLEYDFNSYSRLVASRKCQKPLDS